MKAIAATVWAQSLRQEVLTRWHHNESELIRSFMGEEILQVRAFLISICLHSTHCIFRLQEGQKLLSTLLCTKGVRSDKIASHRAAMSLHFNVKMAWVEAGSPTSVSHLEALFVSIEQNVPLAAEIVPMAACNNSNPIIVEDVPDKVRSVLTLPCAQPAVM